MFFSGPRILGLWLMFSDWILAHVFRGLRIFESWLMFSEDQEFFGLWLMFSEDQKVLDPGSCFQRT